MTSNYSSSSSDGGGEEEAPAWIYYSAGSVLCVVGVAAFSTNGAAVFVYAKDKSLRTPFNHLLMNLVLVELVSACFGLPLNAVAAFSRGWIFGEVVCSVAAATVATSGICSIALLTVLSVHRCLLLSFPSHSPRFNSPAACRAMMALAWAYTAAVVGPTAFGWGRFKTECLGISCGPAWDDPANWSYTVYLLVTGYAIPLAIIVATSVVLVKTMKKRCSEMQAAGMNSAMAKKEEMVTRMVSTMTFAFLAIWTPYAVCAMVVLAHSWLGAKAVASLLNGPAAPLPVVFAKTSCIINPIIYVMMNTQFKRAFHQHIMRRAQSEAEPCYTKKTLADPAAAAQVSKKRLLKMRPTADGDRAARRAERNEEGAEEVIEMAERKRHSETT